MFQHLSPPLPIGKVTVIMAPSRPAHCCHDCATLAIEGTMFVVATGILLPIPLIILSGTVLPIQRDKPFRQSQQRAHMLQQILCLDSSQSRAVSELRPQTKAVLDSTACSARGARRHQLSSNIDELHCKLSTAAVASNKHSQQAKFV